MTTGGWVTMLLSVGFVVTLFVGCILKVLLSPDTKEHLHGFDDIDTQDRN